MLIKSSTNVTEKMHKTDSESSKGIHQRLAQAKVQAQREAT
jgi:hypothetical protein